VTAESRRRRMLVVGGVCALGFALVIGRATDLAVLRGPELRRTANRQHRYTVTLRPYRGPIVDRSGEPLALSVDGYSIAARPRLFKGQEGQIPALARALGMPPKTVRAKLDSRAPFVWLKRLATPREVDAVAALKLPGVEQQAEPRRVYPHGTLAAHVLGFVDVDSKGNGGLESRFEPVIAGESQVLEMDRDANRQEIYRSGVNAGPGQGSRVELTLDADIQAIVERELAAGVADAKAVGGTAVVLDPWTGEVLALANVPTFNPNDPDGAGEPHWQDRLRNRALTDPYEPGSTFKAFLAAAALQEGAVKPSEMFFCENGRMQVGKWTIHDSHPHGWLSFAEVVQYSSNIGASKVGERLGRERYYNYLRAFGFGQRTGIELPGESPGIMHPGDTWTRIDLIVQSFGQAVSVTPIQMASAMGAIANGGTLMRPYLVRRIVKPDGDVALENQPTPLRRVISPETARVTTELLRRVVEEKGGTGAKAALEDFPVAGKTGTAQKKDPHGHGYSSKRIGSFVGFVPADRPRLVILVLIDEPGGTTSYGGIVAAPVFRNIATNVLRALGVQPTAPVGPEPMMAQVVPAAAPVEPEPPAVEAPRPGDTPNLLGLSLREALTRANAAGCAVDVSGMGYVATQVPAPGAPLASERRLALQLRPERNVARP